MKHLTAFLCFAFAALACGQAPPAPDALGAPVVIDDPNPQPAAVDPTDRTQGGVYEWGPGPDGRETVIAVEGRPVVDHIDQDDITRAMAKREGLDFETLKAKIAEDTASFVEKFKAGAAIDDLGEGGAPPAFLKSLRANNTSVLASSSHHPTYLYGMGGLGADLDSTGEPHHMTGCTCGGPGGLIASAGHNLWDCQHVDSGSHNSSICLFPKSKALTYSLGDEGIWGSPILLDYFRARMNIALADWGSFSSSGTATGFTFQELPGQTGFAVANVPVYPVFAGNILGHTEFYGPFQDNGDLPFLNPGGNNHTAKALGYDFAGLELYTAHIEAASIASGNVAQRGVIDFTNAYENVMAHELGHIMSLDHFTNQSTPNIMELGNVLAAVGALKPIGLQGIRPNTGVFFSALKFLSVSSSNTANHESSTQQPDPRPLDASSNGGQPNADVGDP